MEISILIWIDQFLFEIIYEGLMFSTIQTSKLFMWIDYINKMFAISFLPALARVQIPSRVHRDEQTADEMHHSQRRQKFSLGWKSD